MDRSHRVWKLPSATHIGTTENHISVSPRFLKLPHFEQIGTTEFYLGFTELVNNGVAVGFLEMPIYTPPPHPTRKRSTQNKPTLPISKFLRENHLSLCWGQDHPLQPYGSWFLASPSCFPPNQSILPSQISERVIECWGDYHLKHKSKEFIVTIASITFWRVVPPRLVRCRLGASYFVLWSWTKKFVRARRLPTSWRSTHSEASPSWTEAVME